MIVNMIQSICRPKGKFFNPPQMEEKRDDKTVFRMRMLYAVSQGILLIGFVLTLFNMNYEMQANCVGQNVGQDVGQAKYLSEIIQLIRENNKITKATIVKELGVSEKTIEREMKKTNKIVYIGSGYSGHREIKE